MHTSEFLALGEVPNIYIDCSDVLPKQTTCELKALQVQVYIQQ